MLYNDHCKIISNRVLSVEKSEISADPIVTLDQAKSWLKMDGITEDDLVIQGIIDAAIDWAERSAGISIRMCTVIAVVEIHNRIELPYGPVNLIQSVNDKSMSDLPVNQFIGPAYPWPRLQGNGVYVAVYNAGYVSIPPNLFLALKSYIAFCYEHRGDNYDEKDTDFAPVARQQLSKFRRNLGV